MTHIATLHSPHAVAVEQTQRRAALRQLAREAGADHHIIIDPSGHSGDGGIIAADWQFDAILAVGRDTLMRLSGSRLASGFGTSVHLFEPFELVAENGLLTLQEAAALREFEHAEFACLKLRAADSRLVAILSSQHPGAMDKAALARFQLLASYHLSERAAIDRNTAGCDQLSERELECLRWVSHGKTTDEIALILAVSANTVNSYVSHAVRKLAARNRPMAIATIIRAGMI